MKNLIAVLAFLVGAGVASADVPTNIAAPKAETVTVMGSRPRSFDFNGASGFVSFSSVSPRSLSSPLTLDLITEPVLLRMKTGNAPERVDSRLNFLFESVQDRTVRDSDLLQIKLYALKFD
jgi:hypothetical protein